MSEKKETEGKTTDEMPGNDTYKKDSGLYGRDPIPFSNAQLGFGIMGGRNVSLTALAKDNNVTSYDVVSRVGGGTPPGTRPSTISPNSVVK